MQSVSTWCSSTGGTERLCSIGVLSRARRRRRPEQVIRTSWTRCDMLFDETIDDRRVSPRSACEIASAELRCSPARVHGKGAPSTGVLVFDEYHLCETLTCSVRFPLFHCSHRGGHGARGGSFPREDRLVPQGGNLKAHQGLWRETG